MAKGNYSTSKKEAVATLEDQKVTTGDLLKFGRAAGILTEAKGQKVTTGDYLVLLTERVAVNLQKIAACENEAALRALCVGVLLYRVKANLPHGKFLAWREEMLGDELKKTQAQYYMKLAIAFVAEKGMPRKKLKSVSAAVDVSSLDQSFAKEAADFVGDHSLNELLQIYCHKPKPEPKQLPATEEESQDQLTFSFYEQMYRSFGTFKSGLFQPDSLKQLKDEELETLAEELEETRQNLLLYRQHRREANKENA